MGAEAWPRQRDRSSASSSSLTCREIAVATGRESSQKPRTPCQATPATATNNFQNVLNLLAPCFTPARYRPIDQRGSSRLPHHACSGHRTVQPSCLGLLVPSTRRHQPRGEGHAAGRGPTEKCKATNGGAAVVAALRARRAARFLEAFERFSAALNLQRGLPSGQSPDFDVGLLLPTVASEGSGFRNASTSKTLSVTLSVSREAARGSSQRPDCCFVRCHPVR